MSQQLISRNPDLRRLREEGYDIELRAGHLLVKGVPYVDEKGQVRRGTLVTPLGDMSADETRPPTDHTVYFIGEYPCRRDGAPIEQIRNNSNTQTLARGLVVNHYFSAKPKEGNYRDYHHKMTNYVAIVCGEAQALDPLLTARTGLVSEPTEDDCPFNYIDTAWLSHTVETIRRQVTVLSTPLEISLDCHHHDAINAFQTNIENSKVVMPAAVQQLIKAIPAWMRPLIRIIDGYLVRERVDPKKTSHTSVVTEVKEEVFTEVNQLQGGGRIQDAWQSLSEALIDEEPIDGWPANRYGFDPAVMLGRIVLTGWGPQEIEKAKAETRQQELIVKTGVEGRFWLGCGLALLIPAACFIAGPGAVPQSFLLAAMLFLASVFCLSAALRNLLERALTPVDELKFQALMAGPTLTLAGVLISLANIANPWLLLGLLILLAGLGLSHKVASYLIPNFRI